MRRSTRQGCVCVVSCRVWTLGAGWCLIVFVVRDSFSNEEVNHFSRGEDGAQTAVQQPKITAAQRETQAQGVIDEVDGNGTYLVCSLVISLCIEFNGLLELVTGDGEAYGLKG